MVEKSIVSGPVEFDNVVDKIKNNFELESYIQKGFSGFIEKVRYRFFVGQIDESRFREISEQEIISSYLLYAAYEEIDLIFLLSNEPKKILYTESKADGSFILAFLYEKDYVVVAPFDRPSTHMTHVRVDIFGDLIVDLNLLDCEDFHIFSDAYKSNKGKME